ncbi:MAG: hypothetical protein F2813_07060 [Actinobacteria bacterium]|uniref:Unannotated protein n=1 Tax=freshwater metagenome TaxID=449393 RepID=A0A6J5ZYE4_9ZZZZ|nr:hypothetical protein [Actinomycetota bacterium]
MTTETSTAWWSEVAHLRPQDETAAEAPSPTADAPQPPKFRRVPIVRRPTAPQARSLVKQSSRQIQSPRQSAPLQSRRPDRIAAWAAMLGFVLVLMAAVSANAAPMHRLGDRTLKMPMHGHDVTQLQGKLRRLKMLHVSPTGHFGTLTRAALRRYQRSRCLTADGIAGPATLSKLKNHAHACSSKAPSSGGGGGSSRGITRKRVVTWYGPGWYGRKTACGNTLTSRLYGVAHKTLPCGTVVRFSFRGRTVRTKVVDRGPYASGVDYDLTWAAARKLGVISIGRASVRASR